MDKVKWKYNLEKHCVDKQPTIEPPKMSLYESALGVWHSEATKERYFSDLETYTSYLTSLRLRSIPVQGKVEWKDGEDVTGKFEIKYETVPITGINIPEVYWNDVDKKYPVAIPIIQEQPKQEANEGHTQSEIITGYIHKIDSLLETNRKLGEKLAAQPKQEAIPETDFVEHPITFFFETLLPNISPQQKMEITDILNGKTFYCQQWDKVGYKCDEQCITCKRIMQ